MTYGPRQIKTLNSHVQAQLDHTYLVDRDGKMIITVNINNNSRYLLFLTTFHLVPTFKSQILQLQTKEY